MGIVREIGCGSAMAIYRHDPPWILLVMLMLHIVYFMEDDRRHTFVYFFTFYFYKCNCRSTFRQRAQHLIIMTKLYIMSCQTSIMEILLSIKTYYYFCVLFMYDIYSEANAFLPAEKNSWIWGKEGVTHFTGTLTMMIDFMKYVELYNNICVTLFLSERQIVRESKHCVWKRKTTKNVYISTQQNTPFFL